MIELVAAIPLVGPVLAWVLPFILVLGIVVFIHELGHYLVGRWTGIHAEVFSVGFGKPIWSRMDSRGTQWQVAWLPLGGYVKFVGDMNPASAGSVPDEELSQEDRERAFQNAPLWGRTLTVAAGPVFNFVLSIILFAGLALWVGQESEQPIVGELGEDAAETVGFVEGDRVISVDGVAIESWVDVIRELNARSGLTTPVVVERDGRQIDIETFYNPQSQVSQISPGKPASRAGIVPGDIITRINDIPIHSFRELQLAIGDAEPGATLTIEATRDDEIMTFELLPELVERPHPRTNEVVPVPTIGIVTHDRNGLTSIRAPVSGLEALEAGVVRTWLVISGTVNYLGDMIFANADVKQLGGPIRIAEISSERAEQGFSEFIFLIALISTSIGLLNLFPIPVLDGGHLLFYFFEAIRGRPVGETATKVGTMIGISLVLLLMVFATYNDLDRLLS